MLRNLAEPAALAGGWLLVALVLLMCAEVLLRWIFGISIGGVYELAGYAFAIGTSWSFAYALIQRSHIRIDILYVRLPGKVRPVFNILSLLALALFVVFLAYRSYEVAAYSLSVAARSNSTLQAPLSIPQFLWWGGYMLFILVIGMMTVRAFVAYARGESAWISSHLAPPSAEAEITAEVGDSPTSP